MKNILDIINEIESKGLAFFHFNISNFEFFKAILNVVKKRNTPVFIGVSEGERDFVGIRTLPLLVKDLRENEGLPIFSNADHTKSIERVIESARCGFDAITVDASALSLKDAISFVKKAKEEAKKINPNIVIEGEIGYIGNSSEIMEKIPYDSLDKNMLTKIEDAELFVKETGIDLFAPAVGNFHGVLEGKNLPPLDFERIKDIKKKINIPIVLHGGSGICDEDLKKAVQNGVSIIHISSELRIAYKNALNEGLKIKSIAPYKFLNKAISDLENIIIKKLSLL